MERVEVLRKKSHAVGFLIWYIGAGIMVIGFIGLLIGLGFIGLLLIPILFFLVSAIAGLIAGPFMPKMECPECSQTATVTPFAKVTKCRTCKTKFVVNWKRD